MKIFLVGGFLGSGKTTAIAAACRLLMARGHRVGVITNDQGEQQVDTLTMTKLGIPAREVAGGCFCCNYDQFDAHVRSLEAENLPQFVFAESVGTCTDLAATIVLPLAKFRPDVDVVICIFADAAFLASLLEGSATFVEESVRYIYKKQLEEADLIVINKSDLITEDQKEMIRDLLGEEYSGKSYLFQNSTADSDVEQWLNQLQTMKAAGLVLDIDYNTYGDGEARMAWLDKRVVIEDNAGKAADAVRKIMEAIFRRISEERLLIGHLKFFIDAGNWARKISFTASSNDFHRFTTDAADRIELLINARVQTDPRRLTRIVDDVIENMHATGRSIT
ncbi:MAG TPA: GTP-binding protein, partial [Cyclobacteriaceae bacterium]